MKKFVLAAALALGLGACSNSQLTSINNVATVYDQDINNFNAAAAAISSSVALTSASLSGYCQDAKTAGQNLEPVIQSNKAALTALNQVTAGLNAYCKAPPQDVGGAIVNLTAIIQAAYAAR